MKRTIAVSFGEDAAPLGILRYNQQGARESAAFEYQPEWLAAGDRFAIEPGLPLFIGRRETVRCSIPRSPIPNLTVGDAVSFIAITQSVATRAWHYGG